MRKCNVTGHCFHISCLSTKGISHSPVQYIDYCLFITRVSQCPPSSLMFLYFWLSERRWNFPQLFSPVYFSFQNPHVSLALAEYLLKSLNSWHLNDTCILCCYDYSIWRCTRIFRLSEPALTLIWKSTLDKCLIYMIYNLSSLHFEVVNGNLRQ